MRRMCSQPVRSENESPRRVLNVVHASPPVVVKIELISDLVVVVGELNAETTSSRKTSTNSPIEEEFQTAFERRLGYHASFLTTSPLGPLIIGPAGAPPPSRFLTWEVVPLVKSKAFVRWRSMNWEKRGRGGGVERRSDKEAGGGDEDLTQYFGIGRDVTRWNSKTAGKNVRIEDTERRWRKT